MKLSYQIVSPPPDKARDSLSPVVLLHGRMDSKKTWRHLAPQIAEKTGRKVYCLDARNHGESPWSNVMDYDALVQDLQEFLSEQNLNRIIIVGHSMGGRTAMFFALKKPEMVEKLLIEDMVASCYSSLAKISVLQMLNLLRQSLHAIPDDADELTAKRVVAEYIKSQLPPEVTEKRKSSLFDLDTMPIKREDNKYKWQANLDVLEEFLNSDRNNKPMHGIYYGEALFLYGTESFFNVPDDQTINNFFPKAVKVPVQSAGHLVHQDCPDEFVHHVIKFINNGDNNVI